MKQETIQIRHQNVKLIVTEIPIDPENCPFAIQHTWGRWLICILLHNSPRPTLYDM